MHNCTDISEARKGVQTAQYRVYHRIKQELSDGKFAANEKLPPLRTMVKTYGEGLGAVRQAVLRLQIEGRVKARQGSGIYATSPLQPQLRTVLLAPLQGHVWDSLAKAFVRAFGTQEALSLELEALEGAPDEISARLTRRIEKGRIDVLMFSDYPQCITDVVGRLKDKVHLFGIYNIIPVGPLVECGRVVSDWQHGHRLAVNHLMDIGCRNILILSNAVGYAQEDECSRIIRRSGLDATMHVVRPMPGEDHVKMTMGVLREHPEIDGIFSLTDYRLAGLLPSLLQNGYRIPDDLALVGYYNTPWSQLAGQELTSVSTKPDEIASEACRLISSGLLDEERIIKPELIVRKSSQRDTSRS